MRPLSLRRTHPGFFLVIVATIALSAGLVRFLNREPTPAFPPNVDPYGRYEVVLFESAPSLTESFQNLFTRSPHFHATHYAVVLRDHWTKAILRRGARTEYAECPAGPGRGGITWAPDKVSIYCEDNDAWPLPN